MSSYPDDPGSPAWLFFDTPLEIGPVLSGADFFGQIFGTAHTRFAAS